MRRKGNGRSTEPGIDRRDFLNVGALGIAGSLASNSGAAAQQQGQSPGDRRRAETEPPAAEHVNDPAALEAETWQEPWTWRPEDWPGEALHLNVIENQNPGPSTSAGSPFHSIFSYGGISPAPTIRVRGDGLLKIKLRNLLGLDEGVTPVGYHPDPFDLTPEMDREFDDAIAKSLGLESFERPQQFNPFAFIEELYELLPVETRPGACMVDHANGPHSVHVTNLHTHGLHVEPNANPNGSQSDNVMLRVLNHDDWAARQRSEDPACRYLGHNEHVAEIDFEYHLGDVMRARRHRLGQEPQPQPPGTHWYHPHAHGSTHNQVASGMAGFLILEGDVDDAINEAMTGDDRPDPARKSGPYDYRERVILIQRVQVAPNDLDAPKKSPLRVPPVEAVNGAREAGVLFMRPGAVERWRVLNGSVDGRGFKRFMVVLGHFVYERNRLWRVVEDAGDPSERRLEPATRQEVEDAKMPLYQLAMDGITLVTVEQGRPRYTIKDLSLQNSGSRHPLARPFREGEEPDRERLRNIEACYRDGRAVRDSFVRPNEVYLGPANRTDVFFKAPIARSDQIYTLLARESLVHNDNFQQGLQIRLANNGDPFGPGNPRPVDVVAGHVHVRGEPVDAGDFDVMSLRDRLPEVPPFLLPVEDEELAIPAEEARRGGVPEGSFRTRTVSYSGWGGAEFPLVEVPKTFAHKHPELETLLWAEHDGTRVLLPPGTATMAINPNFDLSSNPDPPAARKFAFEDSERVKVLADSAEEWALYNTSTTLWAHTDTDKHPQQGQWKNHYRSYPITRAEGQARFASDPEFRITAKGVDHPFHIHINPCWVTRIEIPDENGALHNILDEPRWMDTMWIPRDGGRVVFRTRYPDFTGLWVNHCHVLLHEDNGMMQIVEATNRAEEANYNAKRKVASCLMSDEECNQVYPRPSLELAYRQSLSFVDPNPSTGQTYPGFAVAAPKLDED